MAFGQHSRSSRPQPEATYERRYPGDTSRRFGTGRRDPYTGRKLPGEVNEYGQPIGTGEGPAVPNGAGVRTAAPISTGGPGAPMTRPHDWSGFDQAFSQRRQVAPPSPYVSSPPQTQDPTAGSAQGFRDLGASGEAGVPDSPYVPAPSYTSGDGGYGATADVGGRSVQYDPGLNGGMAQRVPGWMQMTPQQRAAVYRQMPGTGQATQSQDVYGSRGDTQTPTGTMYDPAHDTRMIAGAVDPRDLPPGVSRGIHIDPRYVTPGTSGVGYGTGSGYTPDAVQRQNPYVGARNVPPPAPYTPPDASMNPATTPSWLGNTFDAPQAQASRGSLYPLGPEYSERPNQEQLGPPISAATGYSPATGQVYSDDKGPINPRDSGDARRLGIGDQFRTMTDRINPPVRDPAGYVAPTYPVDHTPNSGTTGFMDSLGKGNLSQAYRWMSGQNKQPTPPLPADSEDTGSVPLSMNNAAPDLSNAAPSPASWFTNPTRPNRKATPFPEEDDLA